MTADTACLLAVLAGGVAPSAIAASRGDAASRVVGLQLSSAAAVLALVLFAFAGQGQIYDLIVPLVLSACSVTGTLVFTRLVDKGDGEEG